MSPLYDDLYFGESPRWYDGCFWFSDISRKRIVCLSERGDLLQTIAVEFSPSGLGWTTEGELRVVAMEEQAVYSVGAGGHVREVSSASGLCKGWLNDMVIDGQGRAYVSSVGFDYEKGEKPCSTALLRIDPDGSVTAVAPDIMCPNGLAILADGQTLIVGQSLSPDILSFQIAADGSLHRRRVYASLPDGAISDGICVDAEDAVWSAGLVFNAFTRIQRGGTVTHRISTGDRYAVACMLGGADGKTLFGITATTENPSLVKSTGYSRIECRRVEVARAGLP